MRRVRWGEAWEGCGRALIGSGITRSAQKHLDWGLTLRGIAPRHACLEGGAWAARPLLVPEPSSERLGALETFFILASDRTRFGRCSLKPLRAGR